MAQGDINIYGTLHNNTPDGELARAAQISIVPIEGVDGTTVQQAIEDLSQKTGQYMTVESETLIIH